jgi:hypothetical protein
MFRLVLCVIHHRVFEIDHASLLSFRLLQWRDVNSDRVDFNASADELAAFHRILGQGISRSGG